MKKRIALVMAVMMMAGSLAGCGGGAATGTEAGGAGTTGAASQGAEASTEAVSTNPGKTDVVIRVESPWSTFNPLESSLYVEFYELNQMYETLTWVDDDGTIVPLF